MNPTPGRLDVTYERAFASSSHGCGVSRESAEQSPQEDRRATRFGHVRCAASSTADRCRTRQCTHLPHSPRTRRKWHHRYSARSRIEESLLIQEPREDTRFPHELFTHAKDGPTSYVAERSGNVDELWAFQNNKRVSRPLAHPEREVNLLHGAERRGQESQEEHREEDHMPRGRAPRPQSHAPDSQAGRLTASVARARRGVAASNRALGLQPELLNPNSREVSPRLYHTRPVGAVWPK